MNLFYHSSFLINLKKTAGLLTFLQSHRLSILGEIAAIVHIWGRLERLHASLDKQIVDNPRLFVDNCLSLWTSQKQTENIYKFTPPDIANPSNAIQHIDGKEVLLILWISLWMGRADSLHRESRFR